MNPYLFQVVFIFYRWVVACVSSGRGHRCAPPPGGDASDPLEVLVLCVGGVGKANRGQRRLSISSTMFQVPSLVRHLLPWFCFKMEITRKKLNPVEATSAFSLAWQKAYSDQTCCAGCVGVPRRAENPAGYAHKSILVLIKQVKLRFSKCLPQ